MHSTKSSRFFFVFLALGFFASISVGCNGADTVPTSSPTATNAPTETLLPILPTSTYAYPTLTPIPTDVPYPTASVVKSNAVAFIEREYWTGNLSLWIANVDGSGERKLTDIESNESWLSYYLLKWSPDGKWVGYVSGNDLWIISHDGSIKRKLLFPTDESMGNKLRTYMWTPDSSKIIFENVFFDRLITPPPEGWPQPIVGIIDITTEKITVLPIHDSLTSLTPDGSRILLNRVSSFILFDISTGKSVEIKSKDASPWNQCTAGRYDQMFWSWSPNGQWFVYSWHGSGHFYSRWLCVSNLDGTVNYEIDIEGDIYTTPLAWDRTSDYVYLVARNFDDPLHTNINPDLRLVRFDIKTQKVERLLSLTDDSFPYDLFWHVSVSPDGQNLELDASISDKHHIYVMDLNSMSITKFSISEIPDTRSYYKGWSADNRHIVFAPASNNYFYTLDIQTGDSTIISGLHPIEYWAVSPVAATP